MAGAQSCRGPRGASVRHVPQSHLPEDEGLGYVDTPSCQSLAKGSSSGASAPSHSSPATASAGRAVGASEVLGQRQARVISSGQVGHQQCQCERGRRKQSAPSTALARIQETLQNVSSTPAVRSRWRRLRLSHQMRHPTRASGFLLVPKQESRLERDVSS